MLDIPSPERGGKAKHRAAGAWEQSPAWGHRVSPALGYVVLSRAGFGCGAAEPWRSTRLVPHRPPKRRVVLGIQRHLGLAAAPALLPQPAPRHGHQPCWSWPCSTGWPCVGLAMGDVCEGDRGTQSPAVITGTALGAAGTVLHGALRNHHLSCSAHVFAFACLIFSTPFATFPAPSLHFSLLFPILPLFFCFFSFCSSCLSRAAARGDGVVGSSGRWAACRGAFGSSPGSRQARGVRAGT